MKTTSWKRSELFSVILPMVFAQLGLIGSILEAHASTTIAVSTNSDTVANDGLCSLREAIAAANTDVASGASVGECPAGSGSDTITVPGMQISLSSQLVISSPIVLVGAGVGNTVIKGNGGVFLVNFGEVALRSLTVQGAGTSGNGRGITVDAGIVEMSDVRITGNFLFGGGGGLYVAPPATITVRRSTIDQNQGEGAGNGGAGGIANRGNLVVQESLIAGNTSNRTGGIWNGPGAILNLCNTTVSGNEGNSPDAGTGGLLNIGYAFLNNVTMTENKGRGNNLGSFRGGGLLSFSNATTIVTNSVIANNDGRGGPNDCAGVLDSASVYNLIRDTTACQLPPDPITFQLNQDPKLGPLGFNGGPTRTHPLAVGSPAIDKAGPVDYPIDQRGYMRSVDGNGDGLAKPDIGAYELGATAASTSSSTPCRHISPPTPPSPAPPTGLRVQ
jgi:CSLREA domain-containing protein